MHGAAAVGEYGGIDRVHEVEVYAPFVAKARFIDEDSVMVKLLVVVLICWIALGFLLATIFGRMVAWGQQGWPEPDQSDQEA